MIRFTLARDLDRLGVRRMWVSSSLLFIAGCTLLMTASEIGWQIYLARTGFAIGLAGMLTSSNVHIQNQVPPLRRTEIIGALGSSGFLGMITGAQLGDLIYDWLPLSRGMFVVMFGTTAVLGMCYLFIVLRLTRGDEHVHQPDTPPVLSLLRQHWPGPVIVVALAMGVSFVVTTVFLTRQATALDLVGVRTFFTGYALSAFCFRIVSRTWSRTIGRHKMILVGLLGHVVGHLLLIRVTREWDYVAPALFAGFGHALLFPCVVSLGAEGFPVRYRGTGTTVILGFIDVGMALAAQPLGWVIDRFGFTAMYLSTAGFCLTSLVVYGVLRGGAVDTDQRALQAALERTPLPPTRTADPEPEKAAVPVLSSR